MFSHFNLSIGFGWMNSYSLVLNDPGMTPRFGNALSNSVESNVGRE